MYWPDKDEGDDHQSLPLAYSGGRTEIQRNLLKCKEKTSSSGFAFKNVYKNKEYKNILNEEKANMKWNQPHNMV